MLEWIAHRLQPGCRQTLANCLKGWFSDRPLTDRYFDTFSAGQVIRNVIATDGDFFQDTPMRVGEALLLRVAFLFLALCWPSAVIRPADFDQDDFKQARKQAEKGDPEAELTVGMMYFSGEGVPQHYGEALKWYRRAAEHGNPIAQNKLGAMYVDGQGVLRNPIEGAKWVRMAANQGYPKAQMYLGTMFVEGIGVGRNPVEALRWFRRAADQGDAEAERNLGSLYADGQIVRADYVEAYKWFSLAASQGDDEAAKDRDLLAHNMSSQQITAGQRASANFVPRPEPGRAARPKRSGSGFFVTPHGHLLTAFHVVESASRIVIRTKQLRFSAQVVRADKTNDIAILKVTGVLPYLSATNRTANRNNEFAQPARASNTTDTALLKVADSFRSLAVADCKSVKLGDSVATLGFPNTQIQGVEPKYTRGEINSLAGIKDDPHYFQISVQIQPGNSGGPLLDRDGNVIGMVELSLNDLTLLRTTGTVPQNVNYALKSSYLIDFLKSIASVGNNLKEPRAANQEGKSTDWVTEAQESIAVVQVY